MSRLRPDPRGTVIPRYWGDASRFGGERRSRWEWRKAPKKTTRKALLASL